MDKNSLECLSLRDPQGSLFEIQGRLIRLVGPANRPHIQALMDSPSFGVLQNTGKLSPTTVVEGDEAKELVRKVNLHTGQDNDTATVLEHERISFVTYPYEWSPLMLHSAASLTLDLAIRLLPEGLGLKEATPFHILFKGPNPIFVDVTALEKRVRSDATWPAFMQFTRFFLNPLLLNKYFGVSSSLLLMPQKNGVSEDEIFPMCSFWQRWRQPFFSLITVPYVLNRYARKPKKKMRSGDYIHPQAARMIVRSLFRHLERLLSEVAPPKKARRWILPFQQKRQTLSLNQETARENVIENILKEIKAKQVLDVGCGKGKFSVLSAKLGAEVVAVDSDPNAVDATWKSAQEKKLSITPMVLNITKPSAAMGRVNRETKSFLQRANQKFDAVLMLGILPQLTIVDGMPITEIFSLAAQLTTNLLVMEWVGPEDAVVRDITARLTAKELLTDDRFEAKASFHFDIIKRERVPGTDRVIYVFRRKQTTSQSYAN